MDKKKFARIQNYLNNYGSKLKVEQDLPKHKK